MAMGRDTFHQTRLFKAPTNMSVNRTGTPTAFLGTLFQCLGTLIVKNSFLIFNLNLELSLGTAVISHGLWRSQMCEGKEPKGDFTTKSFLSIPISNCT